MIIFVMTLAALAAVALLLYFGREFWVSEQAWDIWARWRIWWASRTPRL